MGPLLVAWVALAGLARAGGTLYVNGVRADGLRDYEFEKVDVRIDANGDIWIEAPGYRVEVEEPASPSPAAGEGVPPGRWWLVTEDHGSRGQDVDVVVNGTLVHRVRSGEGQVIVDLGPFLRVGTNSVILQARPTGAGGGGVLNIYVGEGENRDGTVVLDRLVVREALRAGDAERAETRTYRLTVP